MKTTKPGKALKRPKTPRRRVKPIKGGNVRVLKQKLEAAQKQLVIKTYGRDCFTCPQKNLQKSNCQLGHVPWPRSILSTECKYDIRFTRIQCFSCNIHRGGMGAIALQRMRDEGVDVDAMRHLNEATKGKPVPTAWFVEKLEDYNAQLGLSTIDKANVR